MRLYRRFFSAVFAMLLLVLAVVPASGTTNWEEVADKYFEAVVNERPLPLLPEVQPEYRNAENAYKVQKLLFEKLLARNGDSIAGFKAGVTAPAQMQRFGSEIPASAPLFKSGLVEISDPSQPVKIRPFKGIMLETELAFKTAAPVTAPVKDEAELKSLVASIHACIEVPQVYFEDMDKVKFFDLTAAGIGSRVFLVGPPVQPVSLDPDQVTVKLTHNGAPVNEGRGTEALGGQWKALLWLVNNTVAQGYSIPAGQYLLTGALGRMIPAPSGTYEADFSFGPLLFEVAE